MLLDIPDGEIADGGDPVPVRLLAEFDNILLAHADRSRIFDDDHRTRFMTVNGIVAGTVLVDGFVHGVWRKADGGGITVGLLPPLRPHRTRRDCARGHPAAGVHPTRAVPAADQGGGGVRRPADPPSEL